MESYLTLYDSDKLPKVDKYGIGDQSIKDRFLYAQRDITTEHMCLEIAPLFVPLLKQGENVINIDVETREAILEKYSSMEDSWPKKHWPDDWESHLCNIHYVWKGEPYPELIKERFMWVVGSHVIEHTPDVISWLNDLYDMLHVNGEIRMIVPDMRFNWDRMRSPTELCDLIGNYIHKKKKPTFDLYFEQVLLAPKSAHLSSRELWNLPPFEHKIGRENVLCTIEEIKEAFGYTERAHDRSEKGSYEDAHVNKWTPSIFASQMNTLYDMGLVKLKLVNVVPTAVNDAEFYVTMKKMN
jgi:hypothetical protein